MTIICLISYLVLKYHKYLKLGSRNPRRPCYKISRLKDDESRKTLMQFIFTRLNWCSTWFDIKLYKRQLIRATRCHTITTNSAFCASDKRSLNTNIPACVAYFTFWNSLGDSFGLYLLILRFCFASDLAVVIGLRDIALLLLLAFKFAYVSNIVHNQQIDITEQLLSSSFVW